MSRENKVPEKTGKKLSLPAATDPATSADYAMGYTEGFNDACKPAPAVPDDMVMVPREPTVEMFEAGEAVDPDDHWSEPIIHADGTKERTRESSLVLRYRAMIAAAPAPAAPEGEIVITKNEDGVIVSVTRQDDEGRIISVLAESAAPAVREPLTPDVMWLLWTKACEKPQLTRDLVCDFARAIEQAHGIGGGGK